MPRAKALEVQSAYIKSCAVTDRMIEYMDELRPFENALDIKLPTFKRVRESRQGNFSFSLVFFFFFSQFPVSLTESLQSYLNGFDTKSASGAQQQSSYTPSPLIARAAAVVQPRPQLASDAQTGPLQARVTDPPKVASPTSAPISSTGKRAARTRKKKKHFMLIGPFFFFFYRLQLGQL